MNVRSDPLQAGDKRPNRVFTTGKPTLQKNWSLFCANTTWNS